MTAPVRTDVLGDRQEVAPEQDRGSVPADETLGLIYLRVPTWSPFLLQFYCNGHSRLAHLLTTAGIDYAMADNAFIRIADWERAQQLADAFPPDTLHALLDRYAEQ